MTELASPEAVTALAKAVDHATRIEWARQDLAAHDVPAIVVELPPTAHTYQWGHDVAPLVLTPGGEGVELWHRDDSPAHNDCPRMEITYEDAAALLPQLARIITDRQHRQAQERARRIAAYADRLHTDACLITSPEPCSTCEHTAAYVVDHPPK